MYCHSLALFNRDGGYQHTVEDKEMGSVQWLGIYASFWTKAIHKLDGPACLGHPLQHVPYYKSGLVCKAFSFNHIKGETISTIKRPCAVFIVKEIRTDLLSNLCCDTSHRPLMCSPSIILMPPSQSAGSHFEGPNQYLWNSSLPICQLLRTFWLTDPSSSHWMDKWRGYVRQTQYNRRLNLQSRF